MTSVRPFLVPSRPRAALALLLCACMPAWAWAEQPAETPERSDPVELRTDPAPPSPTLPGAALDVAFSRGAALPTAGARLALGATVELATDECVVLVAGEEASTVLVGPARASVAGAPGAIRLVVERGRGTLSARGELGAGLEVAGRPLAARDGVAGFDSAAPVPAWPLSGEVRLDGARVEPAPDAPAAAGCRGPRPVVAVRLGAPAELVSAERERTVDAEGGGDSASAESAAACVDSADSSTASDPTQGTDPAIDPDARRDLGRIRVLVQIPGR